MAEKPEKGSKINIPEITILPDHPVHESKKHTEPDLMNYDNRLHAIFDILRHKNTKCPITIAIYGSWGTGKTSAMRWLQGQLESWNSQKNKNGHPVVYPVWFDPWKYSSKEDVWRGLIAEVILHCISASNLTIKNAKDRILQAAKEFGGFLGKSFLHVLANTTLKADIKGIGGELKGELFRDIVDEYHKISKPEKAYLNEFETTLSSWLSGYLKSGKKEERMAIFIDDLDRCLPEVTLEVLEALKLYLNIPQLVFVVGLDKEVMDSVIRNHYDEQGIDKEKSKDYLNKIFQVEFHIPPSEQQLGGFYEKQIEQINENTNKLWDEYLQKDEYKDIIEKSIKELGGNNPREIKRMLNSSLLKGFEAAKNEQLEDDTHENLKKKEKQQLRFAQGIQVFLLQKRLSFYLFGAALLCREDIQDWFHKISKKLIEGWDLNDADIKEIENIKKNKILADIVYNEEDKLKDIFMNPPDKLDPTVIRIDWVRELLSVIPFSKSVASSYALKENTEITKKTYEKTKIILDCPEFIINKLVSILNKPANEIVYADLSGIESLTIDFNSREINLNYLKHLTNLKSLNIDGLDIDDSNCRVITSLIKLTELIISDSNISISNLQNIFKLPHLNKFGLIISHIVGDGLLGLSNSSKLKELSFADVNLSDSHFQEISELSELSYLYLAYVMNDMSSIYQICKLTKLVHLILWEPEITNDCLQEIYKLNRLNYLTLATASISDDGLNEINKLDKLKSLDLRHTSISNNGLKEISKLTNLTELHLEGTKITDSGLKEIRKLTKLKSLNIKNTKVKDTSVLGSIEGLEIEI